jgi:hypothetical protein
MDYEQYYNELMEWKRERQKVIDVILENWNDSEFRLPENMDDHILSDAFNQGAFKTDGYGDVFAYDSSLRNQDCVNYMRRLMKDVGDCLYFRSFRCTRSGTFYNIFSGFLTNDNYEIDMLLSSVRSDILKGIHLDDELDGYDVLFDLPDLSVAIRIRIKECTKMSVMKLYPRLSAVVETIRSRITPDAIRDLIDIAGKGEADNSNELLSGKQ